MIAHVAHIAQLLHTNGVKFIVATVSKVKASE
jgi:adenylylsulfate kinase-like enzyme